MIATYPPGADDLRSHLAYHLALTGAITSPEWREAFAQTPRHLFAQVFDRHLPTGETTHFDGADPAQRAEWLAVVYSDDSLVTQHATDGSATSSSSQPTVMAWMLEALDVADGNRVLEIGTGTGYNAALLCHRLGDANVTSVDIDPVLVDQARERLAAINYRPALAAADGLSGWSAGAPYDRIIGTCSTRRVPAAWLAQTRTGGVIVANVGQGVVPLRVADDGSASGRFLPGPATFIEARPADGPPPLSTDDGIDLALTQDGGTWRPTRLLADVFDVEFGFTASIAIPGMYRLWSPDGDWYAVVDGTTRSWARGERGQGDHADVGQDGPRALWDELEQVHAWWDAAGRPNHDRLGLTVTPDGGHTLWVDAPGGHELTLST